MKALSAKAKKFIRNVVGIIVELTPDEERTGAVVAMLDTRDGPSVFPLTYKVGKIKKEKLHKYVFCAIEKSLRLLDNGAQRSGDSAEPDKHRYRGGVRIGKHTIVSLSGFDSFVDEAGSVVIGAYLQAEKENTSGGVDGLCARALELVDEFVIQAGASGNENIYDFKRYFLS